MALGSDNARVLGLAVCMRGSSPALSFAPTDRAGSIMRTGWTLKRKLCAGCWPDDVGEGEPCEAGEPGAADGGGSGACWSDNGIPWDIDGVQHGVQGLGSVPWRVDRAGQARVGAARARVRLSPQEMYGHLWCFGAAWLADQGRLCEGPGLRWPLRLPARAAPGAVCRALRACPQAAARRSMCPSLADKAGQGDFVHGVYV